MKGASKDRIAFLIIDAIIFLLCLFGVYRIALKAYLPFNIKTENSFLVISESEGGESQFAVGDTILSIDGYKFNNWEEVEFYTDGKNIDENVDVSIIDNAKEITLKAKLVAYYSLFEVITISLVALLFFLLPLWVILKSEDKSSIIFHWSSIGLAMVITMTSANYTVEPKFVSFLIDILFHFSFALTPVFFIHFTSTFIGWAYKSERVVLAIFYSFAILLAGCLNFLFVNAILHLSLDYIHLYVLIYNYVFRVFLFVCVVGIITALIISYKRTSDLVNKRKLEWLLLGFLIGPLAFILLWASPMVLYGIYLIPEFLMHLLLISFPLSIAIAIVKYQLMDIDLILRRSVVYSFALAGLIISYILIFTLFTHLVKGMNETIPAVIATVFVAFLLQPAKSKVQKFVDRKFFRVEYNYREEQKRFLADIKNANDISTLSKKIVIQTDTLIPVDKIGFFILKKPGNNIGLLAHKGFDILVGRSLKFDETNLKTNLPLPIALDDKVESGVLIESADLKVFKRWGMVLVFPIKSPSGVFHAFLVLGTKKSGARYYQEDIDLLNTVAATSALTIDRIKLQEELIIERLEAERLEELNKLKSYFVSSVSHELKTPLTSIKLFAELLKDKAGCESIKSLEYLEIIEGESDRLKRLIDNVLDFAKIEKGLRTYKKTITDFNKLVRDELKFMDYQFRIKEIELVQNIENEEYFIIADTDAVKEAIMNLLSNSIKYSEKKSVVSVSTFEQNGYACVSVRDNGIGISETDLQNVFNPFFRTEETDIVKAEGAGLGLAIVKHILDAHHGKIEVKSKPGEGSIFTLLFPNQNKHDEKDTNS